MRNLSRNEQARFDAELRIIKPQLLKAGWEERQILHRRPFAPSRQAPSFTLEHWPHFPLATIKFVDDDESIITALEHSIPWAEVDNGGLDLPFVYSTHGFGFREYDAVTGHRRSFELADFPAPYQLRNRFVKEKGLRPGQAPQLLFHLHRPPGDLVRHYEATAVQRTLSCIIQGRRRLALAIGTSWRNYALMADIFANLWEQRLAKRFLYLPDWTSLMLSDLRPSFHHFRPVIDDLVNRPPEDSDRAHVVIPANERAEHHLFGLPADYFDLVAVEEIYRNSMEEDAYWQALLSHFSSAVHLGLTAYNYPAGTPTETDWFDEVIYRYTLDHAQQDGYRAGQGPMYNLVKRNTSYQLRDSQQWQGYNFDNCSLLDRGIQEIRALTP